ncbi:peptidase M23 [Psychromarinibacter sp. C21-152]|uniref:Peptidase M23 n=1 Tax=Psychromarinibacter sediminicola TaxID=3033385 RepID=A0AAE3TA01_9RHOB|nr:peptidase M23 [Psychromarinibacter sediminicola]MDF0601090.1 peptidase M23 [Psychromarinibacter sediminicola]
MARRAAGQLEAAQNALAAAEQASDRVRALTMTIRAYENGLIALREGLRRAAIREEVLRKRFEAKREEVMRLLGVLQSIETSPAPLLLLHPAGPTGTARSGMIASQVTPALQREAETLRKDLEEIATLRALQESAAQTLQDGLAGVQQARTALSQAISNRVDLPKRLLADPDALTRLIDSAETLEAFASGLTDMEDAGAPLPDFDPDRGNLPLPVAGTVLHRAGEADAAGIARPGIVVATRPRALVTTPWPATIRYRGPLLDYGNVMILEPGGGYLLVLAGLEEVYGELGEVLPAGAPVGLMGGEAPQGAAFPDAGADGAGANRTETLYIEAREGDKPINPAQWFAID